MLFLRRSKSFYNCGLTLAEMIVVVSLLSTITLLTTGFLSNWIIKSSVEGRRLVTEQKAFAALKQFAYDVRTARAVLTLSPSNITLWTDDKNADMKVNTEETVAYIWSPEENSDQRWYRLTSESRSSLGELVDLRVAGDAKTPHTRHIVIHVSAGSHKDSVTIGTSAYLRGPLLTMETSQ